jgi:hypothetical protein
MLPVPVALVAWLLRERRRWSLLARARGPGQAGLPVVAYVCPICHSSSTSTSRPFFAGLISSLLLPLFCLYPTAPQRERVSVIPLSSVLVQEDPFDDNMIEGGGSPPPKRAKLADGALLDRSQGPGGRPRAVPLMVEASRLAIVLAAAILDASPSLE